jgi:hypothetical protein
MRTYIFTAREREAIRLLLGGKISANDERIVQLRYRLKAFRDLASDVDLYLQLSRVAKPVTTVST